MAAFDPIERASELWTDRIGDASAMRAATSIMRVQQLLSQALEGALRPHGITFARYEVLVLLSFSRTGELPLSVIGDRLMVHPTSVTNAIDRLVDQGLVQRRADPADRRRILASLTDAGKTAVKAATSDLMAMEFGMKQLTTSDRESLYEALRRARGRLGDLSLD
jgi:DNA-binding MarR family transcriptional regulator